MRGWGRGLQGLPSLLLLLLLLLLACPSGALQAGSVSPHRRSFSKALLAAASPPSKAGVGAAAAAAGAATKSSASSLVANALGVVMGSGSLALYLPIIAKILKTGASGVSLATWIATVSSFSLALLYPIKKKFPISTYIELLGLQVQSIVILGLVSSYHNLLPQFAMGMAALSVASAAVLKAELSPAVLSSIQIVRLALDSYSLLPQIVLNYQARAFSYSVVTASMGFVGNAIRVFTTLVLVKDPLVLVGYLVGALSNAVLLLQAALFR